MSTAEARELTGQFGEITVNGTIYRKELHVFIREAKEGEVRLERLEGVDIFVKARDIVDFKQKKAPVLTL